MGATGCAYLPQVDYDGLYSAFVRGGKRLAVEEANDVARNRIPVPTDSRPMLRLTRPFNNIAGREDPRLARQFQSGMDLHIAALGKKIVA